jgi:hypothetical protein
VNSDREPTLESLWCIGILACQDTHCITSKWMIYQSKYVIESLLLCYLCIYISYGRIGYCLVVYIVPCLGDHLYSGT